MRITPIVTAALLLLSFSAGGANAGDLPPGHPPLDKLQREVAINHSGEVVEAIPAGGYVYVHVKGSDGDEWLAGPAADLKPGEKIRWNDGMVMKNFTSKTLKRTFSAIRFVEVLQPAE